MQELIEMLPVGMVANGGLVAQIMAELAQRQRNLPGWEAFHYEKISDSTVELTGGLVSQSGASKRWLEPHDCITIPLAAVVFEMQQRGLCASGAELPADKANNSPHLPHTQADTDLLHITLVLPKDAQARLHALQALHLDANIHGARVLACHFEHLCGKTSP